jgi:hypothetical protein
MDEKTPLDRASEYSFAALAAAGGDIMKVSVPLQTIIVIYSAQGMIDNGGFRYFFENDWPGNPPYSFFADAYRRIGAHDAAKALDEAVALFPFSDPHREAKRRNETLRQYDPKQSDPFDELSEGVCGNESIWQRLEQFVIANAPAFGTL